MPDVEHAVTCHEIDRATGERGREHAIAGTLRRAYCWAMPRFVVGGDRLSAAQCACRAARAFDDADTQAMAWPDAGHFDGSSRVVEVVGHPAHDVPARFRVRCEVRREYTAEEDIGT